MQQKWGEKIHKNIGEWLALKQKYWQIISSFTDEETFFAFDIVTNEPLCSYC